MHRSNKPIKAKTARLVQRLRHIYELGKKSRKTDVTVAKVCSTECYQR